MNLNSNGVLYDPSTFCATVFLFLVPSSARRLYRFDVCNTASWQGIFKVVRSPSSVLQYMNADDDCNVAAGGNILNSAGGLLVQWHTDVH